MLNEESISQLKHLSKILRNCPAGDVRYILAEMDVHLWSEPERLNWLKKNLFDGIEFMNSLDPSDLRVLFEKFPNQNLATIYKELQTNHPKEVSSFESLFPKSRLAEIQSLKSVETLEQTSLLIWERAKTLLSEGMISYNGYMLYLDPPYCQPNSQVSSSPLSVYSILLDNFITTKDPLRLFLYSPKNSGANVRISLQKSKERFFNNQELYHNIQLDMLGIFQGSLFPNIPEPGHYKVWIDFENIGEISHTIYVGNGTRTKQELFFSKVRRENKNVFIEAKLAQSSVFREKVYISCYCTKCNFPIYSTVSEIKEDLFHFSIPRNELFDSHSETILFHFESNQNSSVLSWNLQKSFSEKEISILPTRKFGETIRFSFLKTSDAPDLFCMSDSLESIQQVVNIFQLSQQIPYRAAKNNFGRKKSPLEISLESSQLHLLSPKSEIFHWAKRSDFYRPKTLQIRIAAKNAIKDIYIAFFQYSHSGIEFLNLQKSPIENEPILAPDLPVSLNKGDSMEIDIYSRLPDQSKVFDEYPNRTELASLGNHYKTWVSLNKKTTLIAEIPNGTKITKECIIPEKEMKRTVFRFAKQGELISAEDLEICSSPKEFSERILLKSLFQYPWGCAEQTAAKLSGLIYFYAEKSIEISESLFAEQIKEGLIYLKSLKGPDGHFRLFPESEPSVEASISVYRNLLLVQDLRDQFKKDIPEFFSLLDEMTNLLADYEIKGKGRKNFIHTNYLYTPKNIPKMLKRDENGFQLLNQGHYSLNAVLGYTLSELIDSNLDEIEIFSSSKKIVEPIYKKGFIGLLEKWKLIEPEKSVRFENKTKILKDAKNILLDEYEISYFSESIPSTFDMISILYLLNSIKKIQPKYEWEEIIKDNERYYKILSPYTLIKQKISLEPEIAGRDIPFKINSQTLELGSYLQITPMPNRAKNILNYYFILPELFEYEKRGQSSLADFSLNPISNKNPKFLKSIRRGQGKALLLIENMYDTSQINFVDLGPIRVQ